MSTARPVLTRIHRIMIGIVTLGAALIAAIGFAGSYAAVRTLAERQGFGRFALAFPIGIDAGICVLLALDLLLTWIRIPFPLLRQTAWLLTAATIAFNAAAAWPDPLGVGMHAVIPVLFVVTVEAARHAVGRIADITADKHMEGVRLTRWLLSPLPTFLLWRRMKLWELRSYEQTIRLEQERLTYQARLRSRYGRTWRRKAPVESLMPLRLARYGVPLAETAPAGLAAAGIRGGRLLPPPEPATPGPTNQQLDLPQQGHPLVLDRHSSSKTAASAAEFDRFAQDALALTSATASASANQIDASAPTGPQPSAPAPEATNSNADSDASAEHPHPDAPASGATGAPAEALTLDLAPMHPVLRILTADAQPHPLNPHSNPRTGQDRASTRGGTSVTDDELMYRIRTTPGPWSMRRMQRDLGIGQARAMRIRDALASASDESPSAAADSANAHPDADAPDASAATASDENRNAS